MRFSMCKVFYKDDEPQASFTFDAPDMSKAIDKMRAWAKYHSMKPGYDATVRIAKGQELEWETHNEYVED
jgi:hypothetical protein